MLHSVSWNQYFLTLFFLGIIYYVVIAFRFYKWEILKLLGIQKTETGIFNAASLDDLKIAEPKESDSDYMPKTFPSVDFSSVVAAFAGEVKAYMNEVNTNVINREEMINTVRNIASKYPVLRQDDITHDLEKFITDEITNKYPITPLNNTLIQLWD